MKQNIVVPVNCLFVTKAFTSKMENECVLSGPCKLCAGTGTLCSVGSTSDTSGSSSSGALSHACYISVL